MFYFSNAELFTGLSHLLQPDYNITSLLFTAIAETTEATKINLFCPGRFFLLNI
jgi:hypothetical protein